MYMYKWHALVYSNKIKHDGVCHIQSYIDQTRQNKFKFLLLKILNIIGAYEKQREKTQAAEMK